jgi:hypothetical protein
MTFASFESGWFPGPHHAEDREAVMRPSPVVVWSREMHVAGLLAAEVVAAPLHLLEHVAVADLGLHDADAEVAHRELEPEVAHVGGDERAVGEPALLGELAGGDREERVAVDELAALVDEKQRSASPSRRRRRGHAAR